MENEIFTWGILVITIIYIFSNFETIFFVFNFKIVIDFMNKYANKKIEIKQNKTQILLFFQFFIFFAWNICSFNSNNNNKNTRVYF